MKQIIISEEEARAVVIVLRTNWIQISLQKIIFDLISRIEKELEIE